MSWAFVLFLITVDLCSLDSSADEHSFKGGSYTIRCPAPQKDALGVYLKTRRKVERQVLYYHFATGGITVHEEYRGRVNISLDETILTSNILNLQLNDAGAYWCSCETDSFEKCEMTAGEGVFLSVNEPTGELSSSTAKQHNGMSDFLIPVTALTAGSVLLLLLLLFGVWLVPKIKTRRMKKGEEKTSGNGIYEVMKVNSS
ncbi:nicotinamide riboside kinase 1 isoform X1 [Triplophysa dalaica]|uniref:nicotinamide riboside kinase 1 isoform X1 n=1 Tax=Triplophysa dalaica TaxID=1582913 RepID=UPI0024DF5115|nr:nicotinamide riboside kinase 1 isoform X1 [Triplophysa dalaica]